MAIQYHLSHIEDSPDAETILTTELNRIVTLPGKVFQVIWRSPGTASQYSADYISQWGWYIVYTTG